MDYEKKYKEALERAKEIIECSKSDTKEVRMVLSFFPELAESKDERVRKELIDFLEYYRLNNVLDSKTISLLTDSVAWLEKQGEPTYIPADAVLDSNKDGLIADTIRYKREKQGEKKPAWNEEDEMMLQYAIEHFERQKRTCIEGGGRRKAMQEFIEWLKSLSPRSHWRPSEEMLEALESATENCAYSEYQDCLRELIEQLKKL